jgi:benzylsuccinate CoA-transferase BbsF subunit
MGNDRNRNKLGITLELTTPKGKDLFLKLAKISDIVVENFQVGVMEKLGLTYEVLKEVNPDIIMISLSSQGLTGPEKEYRSFGPTLEEIGGLQFITGYPGEPPYISTLAYPDLIAGLEGVGLVIAALRYRQETGRGLQIDFSPREGTTCVIGETIMDYVMNGKVLTAMGNRHPYMAPHGCYRCKGDDQWVTMAVSSEKQWRQLCELMGKPELSEDQRFSDILSRQRNQRELDHLIEAWTKIHDRYEIQEILQKKGIAAGAVLNAEDLFANPHLKEKQFFDLIEHPEAGTHYYSGPPFRLSKTPGQRGFPAPCLGQHNTRIFGDLLKLFDKEIAELEKAGIIGVEPTKDAHR